MMMKTILLTSLTLMGLQLSLGQTAPSVVLANQESHAQNLPTYLVYRHFLGWVNALDKQATAAGMTDSARFAQPFAHAGFASSDLDFLRKEATALDTDLQKQDTKANDIITAFRERAKKAAQANQALPAAPAEIHELQAERTAIIVQHMLNLQTHLAPEKRAQLDSYLKREFAPHISLKPLVHPSSGAITQTSTPTFTAGQQ